MIADNGKPRDAALDLMRGACVLYIVGYWHLFGYTHAFPKSTNVVTIRLTIVVLGLFVFISGYLIGSRTILSNKSDIVRFYKKRLLRIYPPYLLAILLFYVLGMSSKEALAKNAVLISMFSPPALPTLWFVSMIVVFYLVAPLLMIMSRRLGAGTYIVLFTLAIAAMCSMFRNAIDLRLTQYFPAFSAGILVAAHPGYIYRTRSACIVALLLIASMYFSVSSVPPMIKNVRMLPLALTGPLLIFLLVMRRAGGMRSHRSIALLSYAGWFMYLFHRPLYSVLRQWYFPASGTWQVIYLLAVCLPLVVAVSWFGQRAYDQLVLRITKRFM